MQLLRRRRVMNRCDGLEVMQCELSLRLDSVFLFSLFFAKCFAIVIVEFHYICSLMSFKTFGKRKKEKLFY